MEFRIRVPSCATEPWLCSPEGLWMVAHRNRLVRVHDQTASMKVGRGQAFDELPIILSYATTSIDSITC